MAAESLECAYCSTTILDDEHILSSCNKCGERPYHVDCVEKILATVASTFSNSAKVKKVKTKLKQHPEHLYKNMRCQRKGCTGFVTGSMLEKPKAPPAAPPRPAPSPRRAAKEQQPQNGARAAKAAAPTTPVNKKALQQQQQQQREQQRAAAAFGRRPWADRPPSRPSKDPPQLQMCAQQAEMGKCYTHRCPCAHSEEELQQRRERWGTAQKPLAWRQALVEQVHGRWQHEQEKAAGGAGGEARPGALTDAVLTLLRDFKRRFCVDSLLDLGFEPTDATAAAGVCGGDLTKAAALLAEGRAAVGSRPVDVGEEVRDLLALAQALGLGAEAVELQVAISGGDPEAAAEGLRLRAATAGISAGAAASPTPVGKAGGGGYEPVEEVSDDEEEEELEAVAPEEEETEEVEQAAAMPAWSAPPASHAQGRKSAPSAAAPTYPSAPVANGERSKLAAGRLPWAAAAQAAYLVGPQVTVVTARGSSSAGDSGGPATPAAEQLELGAHLSASSSYSAPEPEQSAPLARLQAMFGSGAASHAPPQAPLAAVPPPPAPPPLAPLQPGHTGYASAAPRAAAPAYPMATGGAPNSHAAISSSSPAYPAPSGPPAPSPPAFSHGGYAALASSLQHAQHPQQQDMYQYGPSQAYAQPYSQPQTLAYSQSYAQPYSQQQLYQGTPAPAYTQPYSQTYAEPYTQQQQAYAPAGRLPAYAPPAAAAQQQAMPYHAAPAPAPSASHQLQAQTSQPPQPRRTAAPRPAGRGVYVPPHARQQQRLGAGDSASWMVPQEEASDFMQFLHDLGLRL